MESRSGSNAGAPDAVLAELERVLASDAFANAGRLSRLLRFVVERTLDGRGDEIKEYVLGTEVFDRGADYDPRLDSIVRVEARRLRSKLDEYYAGPGAAAPVVIRMRRGSYVPAFEIRDAAIDLPAATGGAEAAAPARTRPPAVWVMSAAAIILAAVLGVIVVRSPTAVEAGSLARVAVLPFSHYPPDAQAAALADRVTDGVTGELVRLGPVEVVSRMSTRQFAAEPRSSADVAAALRAAWLVEGRVFREAGAVRLELRLIDGANDRKVWADERARPIEELRALEREAAAAIEAAIRDRHAPIR